MPTFTNSPIAQTQIQANMRLGRRTKSETPDSKGNSPQIRFPDESHKNNEIVLDYCAGWV